MFLYIVLFLCAWYVVGKIVLTFFIKDKDSDDVDEECPYE